MKKTFKKIISACSAFLVMATSVIVPNESPFAYTVSASEYVSRGVDVSVHNGDIDWNKVSNSGIDFAIIRAGSTNYDSDIIYKDRKFEKNYSGATDSGISVGAYYYCGAYTKEGFEKTAYDIINILDGKSFDLPIYIDLETASMQKKLGKSTLTSYTLSALDILSESGYDAGVYANRDWFRNYIDASKIKEAGYDIWMAQYPSGKYAVDPSRYDKSSDCSIWQYSSKGRVSGISGNVDVNVSYVNYEKHSKTSPVYIENGTYVIKPSYCDKVLETAGGAVFNETYNEGWAYNVALWDDYRYWDTNQIWEFEFLYTDDDGYNVYRIKNHLVGQYLVMDDSNLNDAAPNVSVHENGDSAFAFWKIIKNGNSFNLINISTGKALDVYCASSENSANICGYHYDANDIAESFNIEVINI